VTASLEHPGLIDERFESFLAARAEPDWLAARRREAWAAMRRLPTPDRKQEEWRQIDLGDFQLEHFDLPSPFGRGTNISLPSPFGRGAAGEGIPPSLLSEGVEPAGRLTLLNGHSEKPPHCNGGALDGDPMIHSETPSHRNGGMFFGDLDALLAADPDRLRPYLMTAVDGRADRLAALHGACWSGGALLYVTRGTVVERPLALLQAISPGGVDLSRLLIVLEEGAEAVLLAETAGVDPQADGLHCGAIEIHLGPGAKLQFVDLQNWGRRVWHFAHQRALVGRDAALHWTTAALGGRMAKVHQHVALVGDGARAELGGAMLSAGDQRLACHTLQHHQAPRSASDLLYRCALQDDSRLLWRGMIRVDRDAQQTDGYQRNDCLMLSDRARADSIPGLEIEADQVKCSHGATAGRVDDEQLFYAGCRGMSRDEAVRLIVAGFFQQIFDRIPLESVRAALGEAVGQRIREV